MSTTFSTLKSHPRAPQSHAGYRAHSLPHKPHKSPSEEGDEDEEDLELPVNPDEGTPLIPDEEGNVEVPT